ncbi:MAG: protein-disulfide reductase DsbD N-terminal domain-containing protein, partial [Gammaproteobacteria bacterium]|nr:protein-disulfide reductase DsbD N-terminal domain-containing protein [Gammaproteobacteria bacterium]
MNMSALRLLALVLSVITASTFYTHSSAKSLSEGINNIFGRLSGTEQLEFLDPEDAFIVSVDVISMDKINVHWQIAEGYYLYKDKFNFSIQDDNIAITD